jgi:hypothetical protein
MKFSIKAILATTTFVALALFTFLNLQKVGDLRMEGLRIRGALEMLARGQPSESAPFDERITLYQDHLRTLQQNRQWFSKCEDDFEQTMEKYGQLKIEDPNQFQIVRIPTASGAHGLDLGWRIFVPADLDLELRTELVPVNPNRLDNPVLIPTGPFIQTLPPGESTIFVSWDRRGETPNLHCRLNQKEIVAAKLSVACQGQYTSQPSCDLPLSIRFPRTKPFSLLKLSPTEGPISIWLSIESKGQGDAN